MPIVTLDSMRKNAKKGGDSDDEGESGGNEYYTGGLGQGGKQYPHCKLQKGNREY
jgi:hypothetical protein